MILSLYWYFSIFVLSIYFIILYQWKNEMALAPEFFVDFQFLMIFMERQWKIIEKFLVYFLWFCMQFFKFSVAKFPDTLELDQSSWHQRHIKKSSRILFQTSYQITSKILPCQALWSVSLSNINIRKNSCEYHISFTWNHEIWKYWTEHH